MKTPSLTIKVALLAIGKTVKRLIGTLSILILVRVLTQDDFGTYKQVLLIVGTIVAISEFSIPKSLLYFVPGAKDKLERDRYLSQSFFLLSIVGMLVSLLLFLFADNISQQFNNPLLKDILSVYAPSIIFLLISQNYFSYLLISLDKHKSASYSYVFVGLPNSIAILVSILIGLSLIQVFAVSLVVMSLQYITLILLINKQDVSLLIKPKLKFVKEQWLYVLPLSFTLLSGIVSVQIDKLVISHYFAPAIFAVYSVGAMQVPFVSNLFESVGATVLPKIVEYVKSGEKSSVEKLSNKGTRKVALLIFPIFSFLYIFADQIITILYTHQYRDAVPIFRIYLLVILMKVSLCGTIIIASGRTGLILRTSIFTLSLNVLLNFILVKHMGLIGPAIATVGSRLLHQGLFVVWVKRIIGLRVSNMFPVATLLKIFFISIISASVCYPLTQINLYPIVGLGLAGFMFSVVYIAILMQAKMLDDTENRLVKDYLIKKIPFLNKL